METGAEVCGITFDGERANINADSLLCAYLCLQIKKPKTISITSDPNSTQLLVTPDPCHMLKNVRNAFMMNVSNGFT